MYFYFRVLSHVRDNSPEGRRNIKMNRYGFEDIRTKGELMPEVWCISNSITFCINPYPIYKCLQKPLKNAISAVA